MSTLNIESTVVPNMIIEPITLSKPMKVLVSIIVDESITLHESTTSNTAAKNSNHDYSYAYEVGDNGILAALLSTDCASNYEDLRSDFDQEQESGDMVNDMSLVAFASQFCEIDEKELENILKGDQHCNIQVENWARRPFDDFVLFKGLSIKHNIEDLSEEEDVVPLIDML